MEEGALRRATRTVADGRVAQIPVDREPQSAEECLEYPFILLCQLLAELDEIRPADRHLRLARLFRHA